MNILVWVSRYYNTTGTSLLVALDLQLLSHSRPVGAVECILIEPLDVEAETAQRKQNAVKLAHKFLLLRRVVTWVPLRGVSVVRTQSAS